MKVCPAMQYCDVTTNPRWRTAATSDRHITISVKNRPILMKFGTLQQTLNPMTAMWPKIKIFKIQNGRWPPCLKLLCGPQLINQLYDFR